ncbi:MAG: hypothetical protein JW720_06790 [Sedimentisphaerales bacterium]|nr:hypothetical protein [Sedimentisphaerales bacterium]
MRKRILLAAVLLCGIAFESQAEGKDLFDNQQAFRSEQALITVGIRSNVYTYQVHNLGGAPIVGFEVPQFAAYNFQTPDGWEMDISGRAFRAWSGSPDAGIAPGRTAEFSMRVSSKGAVLGQGRAELKIASGRTIELPDVWCPIAEPRSHIALVAGVILAIVLFHSLILILRKRRGRESGVTA